MAVYAKLTLVHNQLPRLHPLLRGRVWMAMDTIAVKIRDTAKELVPVRTGALQGSIHVEVGDPIVVRGLTKSVAPANGEMYMTIEAEMFYAPFVEYGTRFMAARPYMTPAVEMHRSELQELARQMIHDAAAEIETTRDRYGTWERI